MDQEQPSFKVTDRRLFNADGSPRELAEEELPATPQPQVAAAPQEVAAAPETASSAPEVQDHPVSEPEFADDQPDIDDELELNEAELAEARDPASFVNFLMSIASNAASALGMMEHPVTHKREVDLELGKHWIDVLGMLDRKTKGNLNRAEHQMMENLLSDLRMQYVAMANATPKQKFSASDITGGR